MRALHLQESCSAGNMLDLECLLLGTEEAQTAVWESLSGLVEQRQL